MKMFSKYSHSSIYRHAAKAFGSEEGEKRKLNPEQPQKLTDRDERAIIREIPKLRESVASFTTKRLKVTAGIDETVCDETVRRTFKKFGYGYYHLRKKGFLKIKDAKARRKFAAHIKKTLEEKIWTKDIAFYFDGTSFQHKYNTFDEAKSTRTMAWR